MSSTLPKEIRTEVIDAARDGKGNIRCAGCNAIVVGKGFNVDHIKPEIDGGPKFDPGNMQILCVRKDSQGCHQKKTRREAKERARLRKNLERGALRRALPIGNAIGGALGCGWALTDLIWGTDASTALLDYYAYGLGGVALLAAVDNVVSARRLAAPPGANPSEPKSPEATAEEVAKKIHSAAKDVITKNDKGDVKITDLELKSGRPTAFTIHYGGTAFPARDDDRRVDVLEQMATEIGGRWNAAWETTRQRVRMTERPEPPTMIHHPGFEPGRPWYMLPMGPGATLNLISTPHFLVVGSTSSGKTSLLRGLVAAACDSGKRDEVDVLMADPKMIEFVGFRGWPGIKRIFITDEELWEFSMFLASEMTERHRQFSEDGVPLTEHKPIIAFLDEREEYDRRMVNLFSKPTSPVKKIGGMPNPPLTALESVVAMARRCRIHLILGTQSPHVTKQFGGAMRSNITGRAAAGRIDPTVSRMMFERRVGGDIPPQVKGRITFQTGEGPIEEFQSFWVADPANGDPNRPNTPEDWANLARLGMPKAA